MTISFDSLLEDYLAGALSSAGRATFEEALRSDRALRRRLVQRSLLEVHLRKAFAGQGANTDSASPTPEPKQRRRWTVAAAAAVLLALGLGGALWLARQGQEPPSFSDAPSKQPLRPAPEQVGQPQGEKAPEEKWLEVDAKRSRVLDLADGSRAELLGGSKAIVHAPHGEFRQSVELTRGGGVFTVSKREGKFRVDTPAGSVTALGTEFTVKLERRDHGDKREGRAKQSLFVAVKEGAVRVEAGGASQTLRAGEERSFPGKHRRDD
ncbi:MAG: FecR family protein [Gemmataceae bacterium]